MTNIGVGLARTMSSAIGMLVLVLTSGSHRAEAAALDDVVERYRPYLTEGIDQAMAGARDLQSKIAAHDLVGARRAWLAARAGWERSEVFTAGFVPELDSEIDAWPNATTGFTRSKQTCSAPERPMTRAKPRRWSSISAISMTGCAAYP